MNVKYPEIEVQLVGKDGNAFSILARVTRAMRKGGLTSEQIDEYKAAATAADYDNLLGVTMQFVVVN